MTTIPHKAAGDLIMKKTAGKMLFVSLTLTGLFGSLTGVPDTKTALMGPGRWRAC